MDSHRAAPAGHLRLVLAYVATFAILGIHVPFVPVWLAERGFGETDTGVIVAGAILVRAVLAPLAGALADRGGGLDPRRLSLALLVVAAGALALLHRPQLEFATAWVGVSLLGGAHGAVIPLLDSMVVQHGRRAAGRLDYGRIRLWGSLSFLVVCVGAGWLLTGRSAEWVLVGLWVMLAGAFAIVLSLPPSAAASGTPDADAPFGGHGGLRRLLAERRFVLLCVVVAALQGSHACYYTFSVRHWESAGIDRVGSAWLWAEGVLAEILLFAFAGRLLVRFRPTTLFVWAALAAVVRWSVLALTTAPLALVAVQWMHALTFGMTHLGVIQWLSAHVPDRQMSGAQTFVAAVATGVGIGGMTWVSGRVYDWAAGDAFWWMAASGGVGLAAALCLRGRGAR